MSRTRFLNICSYIITFLLIAILVFFTKKEHIDLLLRLKFSDILIAIFISLFAYLGNGLEIYLLRHKFEFNMEKKDIILLPLSMNLWGMLMPFQGAMAYMTYFLKRKYGVKLSESVSISVFRYLITIFLSGASGLLLISFDMVDSYLFAIISFLFFMSPIFAVIAYKLFINIPFPDYKFLKHFCDFTSNALYGIYRLCLDWKLALQLIAVYLFRLGIMLLLYKWIVIIMGYKDIGLLPLLVLNLWNMLSLLIKLTPNNIGLSQLVSGILFAMIGLSVKDGVIISLVATIIFSLVALSIGVLANFYIHYMFTHKKCD